MEKKIIRYVKATTEMAESIYDILHITIKTIYPKYYPKKVVDFFCNHPILEHILEGIGTGNMGVLIVDANIVGTGCFDKNHITGVYVLPKYHNQGYGSQIMDCLEEKIAAGYVNAVLEASLPAAFMYEHRGYRTIGHGLYELENDSKLVYEIMEKNLNKD